MSVGQAGYTIGKDIAVDIIGPRGPLRFAIRTGFEPKQNTKSIRINRADGIVDPAELPEGWEFDLDFERNGPEIDDFFADVEAGYYAGDDIPNVTVTETITERGGRISQYKYLNVALKYTAAGGRAGNDTVKSKVSGFASRRVKVA